MPRPAGALGSVAALSLVLLATLLSIASAQEMPLGPPDRSHLNEQNGLNQHNLAMPLSDDIWEWNDDQYEMLAKKTPGLLLILFYQQWHPGCINFMPHFEKAARELEKHEINLVRMNAEKNTKTTGKLGVRFLPDLWVIRSGNPEKYLGAYANSDDVVQYMIKMATPPGEYTSVFALHEYVDQLVHFDVNIAKHPEPVVVGVFEREDMGRGQGQMITLAQAFTRLSEEMKSKYRFARVHDRPTARALGVSDRGGRVIMMFPKWYQSKHETLRVDYDLPDTTDAALRDWVIRTSLPMVGDYNHDNALRYQMVQKPVLHLFAPDIDWESNPKGSNYWANRVRKAAAEVKTVQDRLSLTVLVPEKYDRKVFGLPSNFTAQVVIDARDRFGEGDKYKMEGEFSYEALKEWLMRWSIGQLAPWIKTKQFPPGHDHGPVVEVGGDTFVALVDEPEMDVLIMLYKESDCHGCKVVDPVWREVAAKLGRISTLRVCRLDVEENDFPQAAFDLSLGLPQINLIQAVETKGSRMKRRVFYQGEGDVQEIAYWAQSEATHYFRVPGAKKLKATAKRAEL